MDFMFEDEVDEVGSDVEAYCPKCKADTTHVVISKYEDEIRRVQCNPCGDVHSFRKPRGETEEDVPEPVAARKRALLKKPNWEEFFAKHSEKHARPYEFREQYRENLILVHPKFGTGFVSEVVSESKVELTFKDGRRILVHNRKDIPGLPLAAEGDGHPTQVAKAGKSGKGAKAAAPAPAPKAESKSAVAAKPAATAPAAKGAPAKAAPAGKAAPAAKTPPVAKAAPAKAAPAKAAPAKAAKAAPARSAQPAARKANKPARPAGKPVAAKKPARKK
jgi:hypothetical protein